MKYEHIKHIDHWYETITAYKQGELSEQQVQELLRWKAEDAEHAQFFNEVEKTWEQSREKVIFPSFDAEAAWQKVKIQTIEEPIVSVQKKKVSPLSIVFESPFLKAAAAVLVLVAITWTMSKVVFKKPTFTDLATTAGVKEFYLPDSSKVWLRDNTTLRYSSAYNDEERMVFLDGEAFFEVRKDASKPFTVLSYRSRVIVKGTSFSVKSRMKDSVDCIEVEEGKVAVLEKYSRTGKELMLTKGMKASVDTYGSLKQSTDTAVCAVAPWRAPGYSEHLMFVGTPLKQVIKDLKEKTNIFVILEDRNAESCRFTGEFDNSKPEEIIQIIALSMNMQVEKVGTTFVLKGKGCK
jgi:transmembrane sensor